MRNEECRIGNGHDISKLQKWAQNIIREKNLEISFLKETHRREMENIRKAHTLLTEYDWTTAGVYSPEKYKLWVLHKDNPVCIASIGDGDIFLLGHKRNWKKE